MEYVSGNVKLRDIFLDNGNWWKLFLKHRNLIRISIITNVLKLLVCRTIFLGYHFFICLTCGKSVKVPHSCKSRFCPSCGKKATDNWIKTSFNTLPNSTWQHITFTMPAAFWDLFWVNRHLLNEIPPIAANIIKDLCKSRGFLPGIFLAIHTFGRDLKRNIHIHLSTTIGGLSLSNNSWKKSHYFYHNTLKNRWRYEILFLLRNEFKTGNLKLYPAIKHIKTYSHFYKWSSQFYEQKWGVHLNKQSDNIRANVAYLGKYLKRPPIGETRILQYDREFVTYMYLDHYTKTHQTMNLPVLDFITSLISHIPDKYFRNIRYYGFLANRVRGKLLPIVNELLNKKKYLYSKVYIPWRNMIKNSFKYDPLQCPVCKHIMRFSHIIFHNSLNLFKFHKEIAHGYFPLL